MTAKIENDSFGQNLVAVLSVSFSPAEYESQARPKNSKIPHDTSGKILEWKAKNDHEMTV